MKNSLFYWSVWVLAGFGLTLSGQPNNITTFLRVEKIPGLNFGLAFSETNDKGFIGTGQDDGTGGHGMCDLYVMKVDECGATQWYYRYGGPDEEGGKFVRQTSNGGYIIAGLARSWGAGNYDAWLVRLNALGQLQWSRTFGTGNDDFGLCTDETPDGGFLMGGFWGSPRTGFVVKTNAAGTPVWQRNVGLADAWVNYIEALPGGDIFIAGQYMGPYGGQDIFAARLNSLGNPIWTRSYGLSGNDGADWDLAGKVTPSGNLLISASTTSLGQGYDLMLLNLNGNNGTIQWTKGLQGAGEDRSHFVNYTSNNLILQSGYTTTWGNGGADVLFNVYDTLGNRLWSKTYGSPSLDKGWGIQETQDGGFLVSASTQGFGALYFDPLFIKVDSLGGLANCPYSNTPTPTMLTPNLSSGNQQPQYNPISILTASPNPAPIAIVPNSDIICFNCNNVPQFAVSDTLICQGDSIMLWNNTSLGLICSQDWSISDSDGVVVDSLPGSDSLVYYFNQHGRFIIRLQATCNNVTNYDSIEIVIRPKPVASMSVNPVCLNAQPTQFTGASTFFPAQWNWDFGDGGTGNLQNPNHTYAQSGNYPIELLVTNVFGCKDTVFDTLSIYPVPIASIQAPSNLCFGQTSTATVQIAGGTPPYNQVWHTGATGISIPLSATGNLSLTVQVVDSNGCVALPANASVVVSPALQVVGSPDAAVCFGYSTTVAAQFQGGNGNGVLTWNNGLPSGPGPHTATPNQTTTYIVTASDGCTVPSVSDSVTVVVHPLPVVSFTGLPREGCQPLNVQFQSTSTISSGQINAYQWFLGDGNSSSAASFSHTYPNPGTYSVGLIATSNQGCIDSASASGYIRVWPLPVAGMLINPAVTSLDKPLVTFTNASSGHAAVVWDLGDGSVSSSEEFVYQYRDTGLFTVQITAITDKGCTDIALGQVKIRPPFSVYIPNSFTPNENGLNELFKIAGDGIVEIDYDIFDRWGNSIWSSYGKINAGWDGRLNGKPVPVGVYVYKIVVRSLENKFFTYHGNINLIR